MADIKIDDIRRQLADIAVKSRIQTGVEPVQGPGENFSKMLETAMGDVNQEQVAAEQKVTDFVSGKEPSLHNTLIALEKADVSFKLMMQVRSKLLDAYQEIMRTGV
ncbi:MAG TPA: flagellar hook-basal body complex protein FliE [Candidatus Aminicenantes bacterium]|nr:flagellar hook-basal body complex protein FliE [Candidatus Aminicenantes bacterium]